MNGESNLKMAICRGCGEEIDVDEFDVDLGDQLSCSECGALLTVTGLVPIEVELHGEDLTLDIEGATDGNEAENGGG